MKVGLERSSSEVGDECEWVNLGWRINGNCG